MLSRARQFVATNEHIIPLMRSGHVMILKSCRRSLFCKTEVCPGNVSLLACVHTYQKFSGASFRPLKTLPMQNCQR